MEFSEQLGHSGVRSDLLWEGREASAEPDRLPDGCADEFDLRARVVRASRFWNVLAEALAMGEEAENEKLSTRRSTRRADGGEEETEASPKRSFALLTSCEEGG